MGNGNTCLENLDHYEHKHTSCRLFQMILIFLPLNSVFLFENQNSRKLFLLVVKVKIGKLDFQNREQNITRGQFFRFSGHEACIEIYAFPSSEDGLLASPFIILMRSRSVSLKFEPFTTRVFPPSASQTTRDYSSQFSFKMNSSSRNHGRIQKFFFKGDFLLTFEQQKGRIHLLTLSGLHSDFNARFRFIQHNV